MSSILVTGGAGFIGSHIVDRLSSEGNKVFVLDNLDGYYDTALKKKNLSVYESRQDVEFIQGSILDTEPTSRLLVDNSIEYIIHDAAQPGVRVSMEDPLKSLEVNAIGTLRLLESATNAGIRKIIFASSSSVYGRIEYLPFDEKHPTNPISPYGMSKVIAEDYIRLYSEIHGLDHVMLRYFTVYGPRLRPDLAIHVFTVKALRNEPIEIYGDGTKTRDFTYIDDAVSATVKTLDKGRGVYNIGGGSKRSIRQVAERIIELTSSESEILYSPAVEGDVEHTLSETSKARSQLDWKPEIGFDEGLTRTVEWFKQNY